MPSRHNWTCAFHKMSSQRLATCLVVYCIISHVGSLISTQVSSIDHPWVRVGNLIDLLPEGDPKLLHDRAKTCTSSWMGYNVDLVEARSFHIFSPDPFRMLCHCWIVRYLPTCDWVLIKVWVHNQHRNAKIQSDLKERKHRADPQVLIDACWSRPDSCSNCTCALYQNQSSSPLFVLFNIRSIESRRHEDVTLWCIVLLLWNVSVFGNHHLCQTVSCLHLCLAVIDHKFSKNPILLFVLLEVKRQARVRVLSNHSESVLTSLY